MIWKHNLVSGDRSFCAGRDLTSNGERLKFWFSERITGDSYVMPFSGDGALSRVKRVLNGIYDSLLPYSHGYVLASHRNNSGVLTGLDADALQKWETELPEADSRRWSLVETEPNSLLLFYNTINRVDAHKRAHITCLTATSGELQPLLTFDDEDHGQALLMAPMAERFAVCLRSRGAGVQFHIVDYEGSIQKSGSFASHPHSRWAVPFSSEPIGKGETMLAGWQEKRPGHRKPWIARLDADFEVLNGQELPVSHGETSATCIGRNEAGDIFVLCPPLTVFKLSPKGFPTHYWHAPSELSNNSIYSLMPNKEVCIVAGTAMLSKSDKTEPAGWLAAIGLDEFVPLDS